MVGRTRDAKPNPVVPGRWRASTPSCRRPVSSSRRVEADLTDPEATQRVIDSTLDWYGRCDVLVNNAAYTSNGPIIDVPSSRWQKGFRVQVVAPLQLVQGFVGGMLERGAGRVVNVSTEAASRLYPNLSLYSVTKQAMERLNDYLHLELGGRGVSFNVLHIERVVETETFQHVRDTMGEELATMGGGVEDAMQADEVAAQVVWMVRRPADWSGQIVACGEVAAMGGPPAAAEASGRRCRGVPERRPARERGGGRQRGEEVKRDRGVGGGRGGGSGGGGE